MGLLSLAKKSVKELIEEGYPESVAKKIADGTLPMDEASRQARADAMGMTGDRFLRGHSANVRPKSDEDMFMVKAETDGDFPGSKAHGVAESYARGGEVYDEATDSYLQVPGEITPLRHNADNLFHVDVGGDDYSGAYAHVPGFEGTGARVGSDDIASAVKQQFNNGWQGTRFEDMVDYFNNSASPGHPTDIYNILGSRGEVKIRHADKAAFDPEYNGSNIMGNADPRLLAGVAGATAAGLAAPMIKNSGMISAPRSETLFDITMGARDLERRLEGSPASLLFPSGLVDYLETVNRETEDPNALTRVMALADFL